MWTGIRIESRELLFDNTRPFVEIVSKAAELFDRLRNRILYFQESSTHAVPRVFEPNFLHSDEEAQDENAYETRVGSIFLSPRVAVSPLFDSKVEERFANAFNARAGGWILRREPEPLITGRQVLIPDFSFEKYGTKAYLEIVGFWTKDYLEKKVAKLSSLSSDINIIVPPNENAPRPNCRARICLCRYFSAVGCASRN